MKLYEIKDIIEHGIEVDEEGRVVNPNTGEVLDKDVFDHLGVEFNEGIENLCCWVKNLRAEAKAINEEKKNLEARAKSREKKAESLQKYINFLLNGRDFSTPKVQIGYRHSTSCEVLVDAESLPKEFQRVKIEPNKEALLKWLKEGNTSDCATLVEKTTMNIK